MNASSALLAFLIGFVAGLRSMTAPAVTAWGARLAVLKLNGSVLHFMASPISVGLFSLFALGELIADKLPFIPKRTSAGPLVARMISGGLCGACLCVSRQAPIPQGVAGGVIGSVVGAFTGYNVRKQITNRSAIPDRLFAVVEDIVAIGLAILIVFRFV